MSGQKSLFLSTTTKKRSKRVDFLGFLPYLCTRKIKAIARVAKLVDAPDLGSGVLRRVGSSPITRTIGQKRNSQNREFLFPVLRIDNASSKIYYQNRQCRQRLVKRRTGEARTVWAAIRRRCQLKKYNRQCEQQKVTRSTAPVVPRGLRKASVVNFPLFYFCNLLIIEQLQPAPHPYE